MTEQPTTQSRMYDTAQSRKLSLVLHFLQNRMTTTIEHCRVYKEDRLQAFHQFLQFQITSYQRGQFMPYNWEPEFDHTLQKFGCAHNNCLSKHYHLPLRVGHMQELAHFHHFTLEVMQVQLLETWRWPNFEKYDGSLDPVAHVKAYFSQAKLFSKYLRIHCQLFPTTLKGITLKWQYLLPTLSIDFFETFQNRFTTWFTGLQTHCNIFHVSSKCHSKGTPSHHDNI